jgi:hypothetical protein
VDLPRQIAISMTRDGIATVAWSNALGDAYPLRVASTDATGRFASATQLDSSGAVGDLASSPGGTTLLTWTSFTGQFGDGQGTRILPAVRPAGAVTFGPPETVASSDQIAAGGPHAAFDPRNEQPTAVWPAFLTPATTALNLAARTA